MSFLFDDEEPFEGGEPACEYCGSTDMYYDEASGKDVCSLCFTQSQQINAASQEIETMEMGEVMEMAARTKGGMLITHNVRQKGHKRQRGNIADLDQSQPLPSLDYCLEAFKCVLKGLIKELAGLLEQPSTVKDIMATVKNLWVAYLRAFADAAQFYGELYPEIRFSLRDSFLSAPIRGSIIRLLAFQAAEKIRQDPSAVERKRQARKEAPPNRKVKGPPSGIMARVARTAYLRGSRSGYKEAALIFQPTLTFAASMVWLAVAKSGVSSFQICKWVENGALTLQDSFQYLTPRLQEKCGPIQNFFFKLQVLPSPAHIESIATGLACACRMKCKDTLYVLAKLPDTMEVPFQPKQSKEQLRFLSHDAIPSMLASLVKITGLDQAVLDRSLALLDFKPTGLTQGPMPKPLSDPNIDRGEDLLAVMAIACQMDPTWPEWTVRRTGQAPISLQNEGLFQKFCTNHSLGDYMQRARRKILKTGSNSPMWGGFDNLVFENKGSIANDNVEQVRHCPTVAGLSFSKEQMDRFQSASKSIQWNQGKSEEPIDAHPRHSLLIEYLSFSAQANSSLIEAKVEQLLGKKTDGGS